MAPHCAVLAVCTQMSEINQSSSIQSETRTPVSMADVEHMSSEQPFMICLASFVRR